MRCLKSSNPDLLDYQETVYANIHDPYKPTNIERDNRHALSYDFIEGNHQYQWVSVIEAAKRGLWYGSPKLSIDRIQYCDHIAKNSFGYNIDIILSIIHEANLTPVRVCHGDMSLPNVIFGEHVVFIDPAYHRGLPCRELDEAKIMQSLDGFEEVRLGWKKPPITNFPAKEIHWALLVTHYIRLLRYVKEEAALAFAHRRIQEISKCLDLKQYS